MNHAEGRPRQARSSRHFGGLSGGEFMIWRGPDEADKPEHPEFEEPEWLKPFARRYYALWLMSVLALILVLS